MALNSFEQMDFDGRDEKKWQGYLTRSLRLGLADPNLFPHLDAILSWYAADKDIEDLFYKEIVDEFGERGFKKKFEECLDRLTVSNFSIGANDLFGELDPDYAKVRYRKLIRVFHPDRGENEEQWLNYRAERINAYYKEFVDSMHSVDERLRVEPQKDARKEAYKASQRMFYQKPNRDWRSVFGDPKLLEKRIITFTVVFTTVSILLLVLAAQ